MKLIISKGIQLFLTLGTDKAKKVFIRSEANREGEVIINEALFNTVEYLNIQNIDQVNFVGNLQKSEMKLKFLSISSCNTVNYNASQIPDITMFDSINNFSASNLNTPRVIKSFVSHLNYFSEFNCYQITLFF